MPRETLEEHLDAYLIRRLESITEANELADRHDVSDWISHPLTEALSIGLEADILNLGIGFMSNGLTLDERKTATAKIEVYNQIREYLESGILWLETKEEKEEDADSNRTPRSIETE